MRGWLITDHRCPRCDSKLRSHMGKYHKYLCKKCNEYMEVKKGGVQKDTV
jgi:transposase-like protein